MWTWNDGHNYRILILVANGASEIEEGEVHEANPVVAPLRRLYPGCRLAAEGRCIKGHIPVEVHRKVEAVPIRYEPPTRTGCHLDVSNRAIDIFSLQSYFLLSPCAAIIYIVHELMRG